MAMTEKQRVFCEEYLKDLNGARAYKVAYPNVKKDSSARTNASKLLTNTNIKAYIDERLEEMRSERVADAQEVLEFLSSVMRGEQKEQTLMGIGDGVQDIADIEVGATQRIKAAELIGKRYALFTDRQEVKQENKNIEIIIGDWSEEDET